MAAAFGAATALVAAENTNAYLPIRRRHLPHTSHSNKVTLRLSTRPGLRIYSKTVQPGRNSSAVVRAQLNEVPFYSSLSIKQLFWNFHSFVEKLLEPSVAFKVAVDGSPENAVQAEGTLSEAKLSNEPALASEESLSEFMNQVASLVKMVDSKDIVELQLKQLDCEILIRKKEALPPPPVQYVQAQPKTQTVITPPVPVPTVSTVPTAAPSPKPTPALAPQALKSSCPPFKCPMAGSFYRSPAPGEPPFVKIGDTVKKGQVLCIIEAMKLMNDIEADQSGTLVEILVEDGKPVTVGTMPLKGNVW
ncbi:biotin carboxyl carrier protein of acetyl-CoAcarboxylase [Striga asiatica]|uniref:Biotin carboxyl carrier protein of acetyl-CoA carboxylase n=1 Tax=Striga asiatica TaxID=4170 RepID=A0A5A7P6H3_STRAF|nr:biotin carboxyl carrier protein of acetyl-CoAcarboxylase [Striga asiatica]